MDNSVNCLSSQNEAKFCLSFQIKFLYLQYFVEFCESLSDTITYFEAEETRSIDSKPDDLWQIDVYLAEYPELEKLEKEINLLSRAHNVIAPKLSISPIQICNWVEEVQKTFVPITAGQFFIHCSDNKEELPKNKIIIEINAGCAFGTGGHETTSNCLTALSELKDMNFINCLDMGCGSGILAIAMSKLWNNQVIAVDIDEQAALVTKDNCFKNNVNFIKSSQSNGYDSMLVKQNAPYQLITANILAAPLIEMAKDAYESLTPNGILIIAGFLVEQRQAVLTAHEQQGFKLLREICLENWPALILKKMD